MNTSRITLAAAYAVMMIGAATAITLSTTTEAEANSKCGGLNQRVCKKWEQLRGCDKGLHRTSPIGGTCTRDNKLIPDFIEDKPIRLPKVPKFYEASQTQCGGANQRVCKKTEQLRGCDPGLHRTLPVGGICTPQNKLAIGSNLVQSAEAINNGTAAQQRALKSIATCIARQRSQFKDAVKNRNMDAASRVAFTCVTPQTARALQAAPTAGVRVSGGERAKFFHTLSIGVGGGAMYGVGGNGESGIVLSLDGVTWPKFYTAGGVNVGVGAAAGADVIIGVSRDRLEAGRSQNLSVNASGKYVAGGGISVTFDYANPFKENPFNGISVSGGAGVGFEVGTVNPTWSRVY